MQKIILAIIISCISGTIFAGIKFTPIQLYLGDKGRQRSTTVVVESTGFTKSKIFEISALNWSQNEKGEDVLVEDKTLMFNPKVFELKPESKQIVRVGFAQQFAPSELEKEKTWRVIFNEVTPVADDESINFQFKFSLPLFVGKQYKTDLGVQLKTDNNVAKVDVINKANSHVQITDIKLFDKKDKEILSKSFNSYLLAGHEYSFDLGAVNIKDKSNVKVKIKTDKDGDLLEY